MRGLSRVRSLLESLGRCWHCCLLPNPREDAAAGGRASESLPLNYSAAGASCCPRRRRSREAGSGLSPPRAGSGRGVGGRGRQPGPWGCWPHSLGCRVPLLPLQVQSYGQAQEGPQAPGGAWSCPLPTVWVCCSMEKAGLAKLLEPGRGVRGKQEREGKPSVQGTKPRLLS